MNRLLRDTNAHSIPPFLPVFEGDVNRTKRRSNASSTCENEYFDVIKTWFDCRFIERDSMFMCRRCEINRNAMDRATDSKQL